MSRNKKNNSENQEPQIKETRKEALTRLFLENGLVKVKRCLHITNTKEERNSSTNQEGLL